MKKKLLQNTDFFLALISRNSVVFRQRKQSEGQRVTRNQWLLVCAGMCVTHTYIYIYFCVCVCVIMRDNIWQASSTGDSLFNGGSELPLQLITMMNVQTVATSVWEQEQPLSPVQWIQMLRARRHADTSFNTVKCHCSGNASKWLNLCLRIK